jgi:hypothetical protein
MPLTIADRSNFSMYLTYCGNLQENHDANSMLVTPLKVITPLYKCLIFMLLLFVSDSRITFLLDIHLLLPEKNY